MNIRPVAPAAERNRQPILDVISTEFRDCSSVLEIGSGTGQHAVFFGRAMPWLKWQTSDLAENHECIVSWINDSRLTNVLEPRLLDVESSQDFDGEYDAVFSANTAHIMPIEAVHSMFTLVGRLLPEGGVFCLYGPFNRNGKFTSDSNRRFHESLRGQNPAMGIRDLAELDESARECMMRRDRLYALPANNMLAVWRKHNERGAK